MKIGRDPAASYGAAPLQHLRSARWTVRAPIAHRGTGFPDLQTQLEELLDEVWKQEAFEREHPFTCGVIREGSAQPRSRQR